MKLLVVVAPYYKDIADNLVAGAVATARACGAEVDVIVYLTTRFFGLKNFGALYGGLLGALSIGTALGPYAAARVFGTPARKRWNRDAGARCRLITALPQRFAVAV